MKNRTELDSGCFVSHRPDPDLSRDGCLNWCQVIGDGDAARRISLFYAEVLPGISPAIDTGPGSLIFLPRRQPHSLECTCDDGLELMGLFYPAGSPAVN